MSSSRAAALKPDRQPAPAKSAKQEPASDLSAAAIKLATTIERTLANGEAALGPDHPTVATIRGNLSGVLQALQTLQEEASGEDPGESI